MKTCQQCAKEFEPTHHLHKYCSDECRHDWRLAYAAAYSSVRRAQDPIKHREEVKQWAQAHPEKVKATGYKKVAKRYRSGKLAPWMYS